MSPQGQYLELRKPGVTVHSCVPSSWKVEATGIEGRFQSQRESEASLGYMKRARAHTQARTHAGTHAQIKEQSNLMQVQRIQS